MGKHRKIIHLGVSIELSKKNTNLGKAILGRVITPSSAEMLLGKNEEAREKKWRYNTKNMKSLLALDVLQRDCCCCI